MKVLKRWNLGSKTAALVTLTNRGGNYKYPYRVDGCDFNDCIVPYPFEFKAKTYEKFYRFINESGFVDRRCIWLSPLVITVDFLDLETAEKFGKMVADLTPDDFRNTCEKYPIPNQVDACLFPYVFEVVQYLAKLEV